MTAAPLDTRDESLFLRHHVIKVAASCAFDGCEQREMAAAINNMCQSSKIQ